MKKIGIVTLFGNYNYGNRLQNYAVQKILEEFGCKAETLSCQGGRCKCFLRWMRNLILRVKGDKKSRRYFSLDSFNKKYLNVRYIYTKNRLIPPSIKNDYDLFAVGSDQVWNPELRKKERNNFFLLFAESKQKMCISPSIAVSEINALYIEDYRQWLCDFQYLSCREDVGAKEIERITNKECVHLVDPTLALTAQDWREIEDHESIPKEPYMVLFFLGNVSEMVRIRCENYAKVHSLRVIEPTSEKDPFYSMNPCQFLSLIDHAALVCTDSYHATAFSINFNTPFYVFDRSDKKTEANFMNSRIQSLVKQFELSTRYVADVDELSTVCDFEKANDNLIKERRKFRQHLQTCLARE